MFLKNKNIICKIRRSKVTDYAALTKCSCKYKDCVSPFLLSQSRGLLRKSPRSKLTALGRNIDYAQTLSSVVW